VAQCNADSQRLRGDVRSWSVDDVTKFVAMVPGCSEYTEVIYTPSTAAFIHVGYTGVARDLFWVYKSFWGIKLFNSRSDVVFTPYMG